MRSSRQTQSFSSSQNYLFQFYNFKFNNFYQYNNFFHSNQLSFYKNQPSYSNIYDNSNQQQNYAI